MTITGKIVLCCTIVGFLAAVSLLSSAVPSYAANSEEILTAVSQLPEQVDSPLFTVMWTGKGADRYEIQYRDSGIGAWKTWLIRESSERASATFLGLPGRRYQFRSRGIDDQGRVEQWPLTSFGDAQTEV
ncbi:MAG: fibronectin type III domain-containing protein, partial [Armatimonadetes bacterium]|nr:fibronectin type III domain-containing protein [Armatimonadota bacterium]